MRLSFDADHLRSLLEFSRAGTQRVPTFEQVLDPALWSDDLPDARIALLEAEIAEHGIALSARSEDLDPSLIGPGLILVGDEGVYLMANVPIETVVSAGVPPMVTERQWSAARPHSPSLAQVSQSSLRPTGTHWL